MFAATDQLVADWVLACLPGRPACFRLPDKKTPAGGTPCLWLFELAPCARPEPATRRASLQVLLRYACWIAGLDPDENHRMLGDWCFAAMAHPDWQVQLPGPGPAFWQALGLPPQPAFILEVPVRHPRQPPDTPLVQTVAVAAEPACPTTSHPPPERT